MGDTVRITVIATGFAANQYGGRPANRDYTRADLFASTSSESAAVASSRLNPTPAASIPAASAPAPRAASTGSGRINDEDYIPDFLRRQR